jgi:hypothetical protein
VSQICTVAKGDSSDDLYGSGRSEYNGCSLNITQGEAVAKDIFGYPTVALSCVLWRAKIFILFFGVSTLRKG